jgi:hypothetical protein
MVCWWVLVYSGVLWLGSKDILWVPNRRELEFSSTRGKTYNELISEKAKIASKSEVVLTGG